jgi:N-dimethylarginine dimethylaminohydrolase
MSLIEQRSESRYEQQTRELQERLRDGGFALADVPGYKAGQQPDPDVWHSLHYNDLYPLIYGRECGSMGIGKLTEVALTEITPYEANPMVKVDPGFFHKWEAPFESLDIGRMQEQTLAYQAALEEAGVTVHRVPFPDPPVSPFGPMTYMWATRELLVLRGGSIIPKMGWSPFSVGRAEFLALWAFQNLGIPPIAAILGTGVCEAGPCLFLAEDVFVGALSVAFNQEGLDQLYPVVQRTSGVDDMTFLTLRPTTRAYFDPQSGASAHPDMVLGPLDVDKVIVYPGGVDYETYTWLVRNGYKIAEVERDEQILYAPANVLTLEPGRVIMHAEARKAIAAVRDLGVDVVEVPYSEFPKAGGGVHCSTMEVHREPGPFSTDR